MESRARHAIEVVEILCGEGMPADRVILSHMDSGTLDRDYHIAADLISQETREQTRMHVDQARAGVAQGELAVAAARLNLRPLRPLPGTRGAAITSQLSGLRNRYMM